MTGRSVCLGALLILFGHWSYADSGLQKGVAQQDSPVLMSKGKIVITQADFEAQLREMPEDVRAGIRASMDRIRTVLEGLYLNRSLAQQARDNKLDQDPLVHKRMELVLDKQLSLVMLDHAMSQAELPNLEALAKEQYLAHPEQSQIPEEVRVSHILIGAKTRSDDEARQLAEKVRTEVIEGKLPFGDLAKKYSEDPSAGTNQGDLGFFTLGKMVKPFAEAAFALQKTGEISPVIKSDFGYHIIRFEARKPVRKFSFEEAKEGLMRQQKVKYLTQVRATLMSKAASPEGVFADVDAIQKLKTPVPVQAEGQEKKPAANVK